MYEKNCKVAVTNHIKINSKTFGELLQRDFVFDLKRKQDHE